MPGLVNVGARRAVLERGTTVTEILASSQVYIPFNDLGSGVVDTTLSRGFGTPTFTRATSAWTILSGGTLGLVASGSARSYYSPGGIYQGYLSEIASTNLVLQSQDFSVTWGAIGTALTLTSGTEVLGALSLDTLDDTSATSAQGKSQTITFGMGPSG